MSDVEQIAKAAKAAGRTLAKIGEHKRTSALTAIAFALESERAQILIANKEDYAEARMNGLAGAMLDRLMLDESRIRKMADAVREISALPDPVGQTVKEWTRPNGLRVAKVRIPLGAIVIIYESRPNVTSDAAALCLRSGNAVVLRGGSEAFRSNRAIARAIGHGLEAVGVPSTAVQFLPSTDRDVMRELLQQDGELDLVIPRGGEALIRFVAEHSRIPVIKHYRGNCHVFVERTAPEQMALKICYNSKVQRPGVCNAAETILIDDAIASTFLPKLAAELGRAGVELRGDERARQIVPELSVATAEDWDAEYLDLICAVGVVDGIDGALKHIERHSSSHTEAIVTSDDKIAERFVSEVGSSTVLINASTRFADGSELGLGAEIGVSTTRLHAYGPMGAEELTTTKFVVHGTGQLRQ